MATVVDAPHGVAPTTSGSGRRSWQTLAAGLSGLLTVVCAVLLPFAPVAVNVPAVEWPRTDAPASTLLPLTAHRPLALDVRFGCDVAAAAQDTGGVVVATIPPTSAEAARRGLLVTAADGRVRVRASDRVLLDEPLPVGACEYRIVGRSAGLPTDVTGPPTPTTRIDPGVPVTAPARDAAAFAGPGNAELVVLRDGWELARAPAVQLPDVDALVTSAASGAGPAVRLRLDDEFTSRPTPLKSALVAVLVASLVATGGLLLTARRTREPRRAVPPTRPADVAADALVGAVLLAWLFVAPATDDDGWFATQARDAAASDGISSYFQLYDHSFVPFTWPYEALARWQLIAGTAPAVQRVPALVAGLLTWFVVRRLVAAAVHGWAPGDARPREGGTAVAAVAFLAWWLPYSMGVRPEALVALAGAATLLAVLAAGERASPALAWLACAVAGAGATAHPAGLTALAPLVAGGALLHRAVAVPGETRATVLRALAAGSGLAVAPLLGFADGALRDVLRTQVLVASVLRIEGWADEPQRYAFLLDAIPMGSYARRAAVLACLVALAWFAVLAAIAAARRIALPVPLWLAAASTALSLVALAGTPSKWTHHFGALAGVGATFLAAMLVLAVPVARRLLGAGRPPWWLVATVAGSFAVALGLTWRGPNAWAYAWLAGLPAPYAPPEVAGVTAGNPLAWLLAVAGVALAAVAAGRVSLGTSVLGGIVHGPATAQRRDPRWAALTAVAVVVGASLTATATYVVTSFAAAAAAGRPPDSVWARTAADPTGCGVADAVRVLDPFAARPLPAAPVTTGPATPGDGFVAGGYVLGQAPQGATGQVWGSFAARDGRGPDDTVGTISTGWFTLPTPAAGTAVIVTAAGSLGSGNALTASYGRSGDGGVLPAGTQPLADTARSAAWRTLVLAPPPGADLVRLDGVDATTGTNGWLAFTTPAMAPAVTLQEFLPPGEPVALGWQLAFGYPCQRPPIVADGITEPPRFAVLRSAEPLGGLGDLAFAADRGGVFAHVPRSASVLQLATVGPVDPYLQIYAFGTGLARHAYTLTTTERAVSGAATDIG